MTTDEQVKHIEAIINSPHAGFTVMEKLETIKLLFADDPDYSAEARGIVVGNIAKALPPMLAIGELLRTQDNRCTDNPMFIVQEQRSFGCEPGEGDVDVWLDSDWEEVDAETASKLEKLDDAFEWELEEDQAAMLKSHTKRGIKHYWEFCMAAFTEEGCKRYLELNGHNLTKPRIYAESWNRCPEMLAVREALLSLANVESRHAGGKPE